MNFQKFVATVVIPILVLGQILHPLLRQFQQKLRLLGQRLDLRQSRLKPLLNLLLSGLLQCQHKTRLQSQHPTLHQGRLIFPLEVLLQFRQKDLMVELPVVVLIHVQKKCWVVLLVPTHAVTVLSG